MRLFALIVGLFLAAVIFTVGGSQVRAEVQPNQEQQIEQQVKTYVRVKPGDSLTKIAKRTNTTYQRLYFANKTVKNPDLIYPGDKLRVPDDNEKLKKRPLSSQQAIEASASERTYRPQKQISAPKAVSGSVWDQLAACESGGNWSINTGNGYYGGLQFTVSTWQSVGGSGYPHQHSRDEQIKRGKILQARSGWGQWPACTAKLGLR